MKRILTTALLLIGMLSVNQAQAEEMLNGAGATFPAPVYSAWAYEYSKVTGMKLNYQSIGSGGGISRSWSAPLISALPMTRFIRKSLPRTNLLQFPTVVGGIVPVVNIAGIKAGELRLDAEALCRIFLGEIKFWDDPQDQSFEPQAQSAANEITVVHRSDGSGTTAIFTHYLERRLPCLEGKGRRRQIRVLARGHRRQGQ